MDTRIKTTLAAVLLSLWPFVATAQQPVRQSGNVTPGHVASWTTTGVIQDGGTAALGALTSLGVTASGSGICQTWQTNQVCMFANSSTAGVTVNGTAIAPGLPLTGGTLTGTLTIDPPVNSYTPGLDINQTGPTSSTPGPVNFNDITVTAQGATSGTDPNLSDVGQQAFRVNMNIGGPSFGTNQAVAGYFRVNDTQPGTSGDKIAVYGLAYGNAVDTSNAGLVGGNFIARLDSGATMATGILEGVEIDVGGTPPATVKDRLGLRIAIIGGATVGSTVDAAFYLDNPVGTGPGAWAKMFYLSGAGSSYPPISSSGDFFFADTAFTVANIFNLPSMTVTGNILSFPNVTLAGNGGLTLGTNASAVIGKIELTCPSCGAADLLANQNSTTGLNGLAAQDSTANNSVNVYANEASRTATAFGITVGDYVQFLASGTSNLGMLIGTLSNTPIVLGTNNVQAMKIQASGGVSIGASAADPGAKALLLKPQAFGSLTACSSTIQGATASVTDSTTNTWGATITGSGSDPVLAYCDGTNWTVAGK